MAKTIKKEDIISKEFQEATKNLTRAAQVLQKAQNEMEEAIELFNTYSPKPPVK